MTPCVLGRALALSMPLLIGGCAALTVDVDVYKGPMGNSEEIRLHQLAAMAVAAQPVLYDLRYDAEDKYCKGRPSSASAKCRTTSPILDLPRQRYTRLKSEGPRLQSSYAQSVEAVLSLYETRQDEDSEARKALEPAVKALKKAAEGMRYAADLAQEVTDGKSLRDSVFAGFVQWQEKPALRPWCQGKKKIDGHYIYPRNFSEEFSRDSGWTGLKHPLAELAKTRKEVCVENDHWWEAPSWLTGFYLDRNAFEIARVWLREEREIDCTKLNARMTNKLATDAERSQALICAIEESIELNRTAFREAVTVLSDSRSLRLIGQPYAQSLAGAAAALLSPRAMRTSGATILAAPDSPYNDYIKTLYRKLFDPFEPSYTLTLNVDYTALRKEIAKAMAEPHQGMIVAQAILRLSNDFQKDNSDKFGLLTYPLPYPDSYSTQSENIVLSLSRWTVLLETQVVSLDRGGPTLGLLEAIDKFAQSTSGRTDDKLELERGLLYFGQKVVSLGDNSVLVPTDETKPNESYVRVLQSIGNSIVSNLDELVRRQGKEISEGEKRRAESLGRAAEAVVRLPPPPTIQGFLDDLQRAALPDLPKRDVKAKAETAGTNFESLRSAVVNEVARATREYEARGTDIARTQRLDVCLETIKAAPEDSSCSTNPDLAEANRAISDLVAKACKDIKATDYLDLLGRKSAGKSIKIHIDDVRAEVKERLSTATSERDSLEKERREWLRLVGRLPTLPPALPFEVPPRNPKSIQKASEVWDDLDHALQYMHVTHVATYGDSAFVQRIRDAQDLVARYRSNTMYLTPATSFLRNSYPYAKRSNRDDQNLLLPDLFRTKNHELEEVNSAVDRQFWQNINRVKVNGAGNVNYVVTKDDIGNWYVKGYSTDGEKIAQSMKNLALFAAGPGAQATLAGLTKGSGTADAPNANAGSQQSEATATTKDASPPSPAQKQFDQFFKAYTDESRKLFDRVRTEAKEHHTHLKEALLAVHPDAASEVTKVFELDFEKKYAESTTVGPVLKLTPDARKTAADYNDGTKVLLEAVAEYAKGRAEALRTVGLKHFVKVEEWAPVDKKFGDKPDPKEVAENDKKSAEAQAKAKTQLERDVAAVYALSDDTIAQYLTQRDAAIDRQRRSLDILAGKTAAP